MEYGKKTKKAFRNRVYGTDSHERLWEMQQFNVDREHFEIYLFGESKEYYADDHDFSEPGIEYQMSGRIIKNLNMLSHIDPVKPILIHMKTCGGDWQEGMAIYNAVRYCPNPTTILSYTHARSMSSLVLQAARKRILVADSYFLFHEGTIGLYGTAKFAHTLVEWDRDIVRPRMLDIYVEALKQKGKFSRRSPEWIRDMLQSEMDKKQDVLLTPQQAVDWGFADEVFDGDWDRLRKDFPRYRKKK